LSARFVEPIAQSTAATVEKGSSAVVPGAEAKSDVAVVPISHRERILGRLYARLQALSGLSAEELGLNTTFLEMGFDSLFLSQVSRALEVEFGVPITLRQVADNLSSISRLADYLEGALPENSDKGRRRFHLSLLGQRLSLSSMTDAQREVCLLRKSPRTTPGHTTRPISSVQGPLRAVKANRFGIQPTRCPMATFAADGRDRPCELCEG
jgi:acyl carrier protein